MLANRTAMRLLGSLAVAPCSCLLAMAVGPAGTRLGRMSQSQQTVTATSYVMVMYEIHAESALKDTMFLQLKMHHGV